jgi:hypothetical protein
MSAGSPRLFPVTQEQFTSDDYYTPRWVFEYMDIRFDLDVCAPPGGIPWIPADHYYTQADDGLLAPWHGRVWMNPPFSRPKPWAERFREHRHGVAIFPHSMGQWVTRLWAEADGWIVVPPPITFIKEGVTGPIPIPVSMAAYGDECVEAISRIGVVRRIARDLIAGSDEAPVGQWTPNPIAVPISPQPPTPKDQP